jgi:hypothetical protein
MRKKAVVVGVMESNEQCVVQLCTGFEGADLGGGSASPLILCKLHIRFRAVYRLFFLIYQF